jgi:hypothetical protein
MHGRRVGQQRLLLRVAVEVRNRAQPSGDGRPSPPAAFQLSGELFDVSPADKEQVEVMVVAPNDELAQVELVRGPGETAVAGQEPS